MYPNVFKKYFRESILFFFRISTSESEDNFLGQSPFIHRFPKTDLSDTDSVSIQVTSLPRMDMSNVMFLLKQQTNLSFTFDGGGGREGGKRKNTANICKDPRLNRGGHDNDLDNDGCFKIEDRDYLFRRNREESSCDNLNGNTSQDSQPKDEDYNRNGELSSGDEVESRVGENDNQVKPCRPNHIDIIPLQRTVMKAENQQHDEQQNLLSSSTKYKSMNIEGIESACSSKNNITPKRKDEDLDNYFSNSNNENHFNDNSQQVFMSRQNNDTGCSSSTTSAASAYVGEKYKKVGRHHDVGFSRDLLQHKSTSNQDSRNSNFGFSRNVIQQESSNRNALANANIGFSPHRKEALVANHETHDMHSSNKDAATSHLPFSVSNNHDINSFSDLCNNRNNKDGDLSSDHHNMTSYFNKKRFFEHSSRQQQRIEHPLQQDEGEDQNHNNNKFHRRDDNVSCSSSSNSSNRVGDFTKKTTSTSLSLSQLLESCDSRNNDVGDINKYHSTSIKTEQVSPNCRNDDNSPSSGCNNNGHSSPAFANKGYIKNINSHNGENKPSCHDNNSNKEDNLSSMMQDFVLGRAHNREAGNEVDEEEDDDDDLESYNYDEEMTPERFVVVNEQLVRLKGSTPPSLSKSSAKSSALPGSTSSASGMLGESSSSATFLQRRARSKSVSPNFVQRQQVNTLVTVSNF